MPKKDRKASSRNLEDHLVDKATVVDTATGSVQWEAQQGEVHSDTHFEDDTGQGKPVVIRTFDFKSNPEVFAKRTPSKQELFNAHLSQIESLLAKDGLIVMPDVNPQLRISKNKKFYRIVVGAEPLRGNILYERPRKLTEYVGKQNTD